MKTKIYFSLGLFFTILSFFATSHIAAQCTDYYVSIGYTSNGYLYPECDCYVNVVSITNNGCTEETFT